MKKFMSVRSLVNKRTNLRTNRGGGNQHKREQHSSTIQSPQTMADIFLICVIVISLVILLVVGLYLLIKYQHPDDKNDAYVPKLIVWFGFVLAGATVLLLPLDVANNEGYAGKLFTAAKSTLVVVVHYNQPFPFSPFHLH